MMTSHAQVHGSRIALAEYSRNLWRVAGEATHTVEDALSPGYLWNKWEQIKAGDIVEIVHEHNKWFTRLLVVKVDAETQNMLSRVLEKHDWSSVEMPKADLVAATVEWGGPVHKYRVVRGTTVLKHGFVERSEAEAYIVRLGGTLPSGEVKAA